MVEPKVKGFAVIKARETLEGKLGEGWFTKAAQAKDPDWPERLLPGDWYSVWTYDAAARAAYDELRHSYPSYQDMVTALASDTANEDLNGLLRAFLWVATPRMFLRTATRVWDTYANFTNIGEIRNEEGEYQVRVTEIPEGLVDWVAGCWRGFLPAALALVGAERIESEIVSSQRSEGADTWELSFRMTYE